MINIIGHIKKILMCGVLLVFLISSGLLINYHIKSVNARKSNIAESYKISHHTLNNVVKVKHFSRKSKEQKYRIYSHHYLAIEHHDIQPLRDVWNRYAKHANYLSENQYDTDGGIVYHKFNDGNYWSTYRDIKTPSNFYHSHMNNKTYYAINKRVLKAHGVFRGINMKK